jgi:hypothetical protein
VILGCSLSGETPNSLAGLVPPFRDLGVFFVRRDPNSLAGMGACQISLLYVLSEARVTRAQCVTAGGIEWFEVAVGEFLVPEKGGPY